MYRQANWPCRQKNGNNYDLSGEKIEILLTAGENWKLEDSTMRTGKIPETVLRRSVLRRLHADSSVQCREFQGEDCVFFTQFTQSMQRENGENFCTYDRIPKKTEDENFVCADRENEPGAVHSASMNGACAAESGLSGAAEGMTAYTSVCAVPGFEHHPGKLVLAAANNLCAGGAHPAALMLQAVIPDWYEEKDLQRDMDEIAAEAAEQGMKVLGGHTQVSDAVKEAVYTVTGIGTTGAVARAEDRPARMTESGNQRETHVCGAEDQSACMMKSGNREGDRADRARDQAGWVTEPRNREGDRADRTGDQSGWMKESGNRRGDYANCPGKIFGSRRPLCPGDELVMTKWIALGGTAALALNYEEKLKGRYPYTLIDRAKEFEKLMSVVKDARAVNHFGRAAVHDLSQGGIFGALREMAEHAGVGLEVDLRKIPVKQETIEICEYFDVNPYELYSAGALLVGTEHGEALVRHLERYSVPAAVIGRVTDSNDRLILNGEDRRYLDRAPQDAWYRRKEKV